MEGIASLSLGEEMVLNHMFDPCVCYKVNNYCIRWYLKTLHFDLFEVFTEHSNSLDLVDRLGSAA